MVFLFCCFVNKRFVFVCLRLFLLNLTELISKRKEQFLALLLFSGMYLFSCNNFSIEDDAYENRPNFKTETKSATYYYDKSGGGFSKVIDINGIDWVHYNGDPYADRD